MSPDEQRANGRDGAVSASPAISSGPLAGETGAGFVFGRYRLFPARRLLLAGEHPVELKSRAFEAVLALVEAGGTVVTKEQLHQRLWPNTFVEPHNLDQQISTLRKALGEDRHLIRTETGRGWRLAAPVRVLPASPGTEPATNVPAAIVPLLGRDDDLSSLPDLIASHRLVTLIGAGGIGKTQLGLEAARRLLPRFRDGVWVVELAPLAESELVPSAIARAAGVAPGSSRNLTEQLVAVLHHQHLLLVIDNCEHLIEAVARVAETLLRSIPRLHVLATSREPLEAEGEHVFRVGPLTIPPADVVDVDKVLEHSAVQLFVDRARAADHTFVLSTGTAVGVGKICRHLDGIPLALELAAGCVASIGVDTLAGRLHDRFQLLTSGRRCALLRHQTLAATLEWSYGLLTRDEQAVFRRVAIFTGSFTLDAAGAIAAGDDIDAAQAATHVIRLVKKSLVTLDVRGSTTRYRLLDTTCAYARQKLAENGEFGATARRHALYHQQLLDRAGKLWCRTAASELTAAYAPQLDDIRFAIAWAFESDAGDRDIGVALATAAIPFWTLMSLLGEYRSVIERALSLVGDGSSQGMRQEMLLRAALAHSLIWSEGSVDTICSAAVQALGLAERLHETEYQFRALYLQWVYRLRTGEHRTCLALAEKFRGIAERANDAASILTSRRMEGASLHFLGNHAAARDTMRWVLSESAPGTHVRFGLDERVAALAHLGRILWLQGFPEQGLRAARESVAEAKALNHANSLCVALCSGAYVTAMTGDLKATEAHATELIACAERHGLAMWHVDGRAIRGWVAVRSSDDAGGMLLLRGALHDRRGTRVELRHTIFVEAMSEALAIMNRVDEGLSIIQTALDESSQSDNQWRLPELFRLRGEFTLRSSQAAESSMAEADFRNAFDLAAEQGARSWQLRAAMSLARLWHRQGNSARALDVLTPVFGWFAEGFETADLRAAKQLLDTLQATM